MKPVMPLTPANDSDPFFRIAGAPTLTEARLPPAVAQDEWYHGIIGENPAVKLAIQYAQTAAEDGDCNVLVTGETGTGKELIARAIHHLSRREGRPYNAINAASIPRELAESLLFGHQRGAFPDAAVSTRGIFQATEGCTVFLY
jgi:DNA-binding NtrC family response regulator